MKNCPFSSTPGEIKECGPDCSFYNQNEDRCGILEIVGVLKELNEKSESLKTCFEDIRTGQNILNEKIKELPSSQNIGEGASSVSESISAIPEKISQTLEPISKKIDNYWTAADSIVGLLTKSSSVLDEIHSSSEVFISGDLIGLLKNTLSELTELKQKIDFNKIENVINELGKNEKDYYDTLVVDIKNSIEKSQALFTENISSYLSSVSSYLEKISSEPNYKEILEYLKNNDYKKNEEREKLFKRFEELSKQNQNDLLSSVESYFASLKGEISSLPSSV
ncbi:hypothetical protein JW890_09055, partial [candidate division WOR-3 bacterium]|nr:hypothetical protein [candidate division WOR-3 bacterium]